MVEAVQARALLPVLIFLARRQMLGITPAIVLAFGTSLMIFVLNRDDRAGPILGLSILELAMTPSSAAISASTSVDFGGHRASDFAMVAVLLVSIAKRRPITGVLAY